MKTGPRLAARAATRFLLALGVAACGGGGGGGSAPPDLSISTVPITDGVIGTPYTHTFIAFGGTGARTFRISTGALPAGLALNPASGEIAGLPTGPAGTANITLSVTDSGSPQQSESRPYALRIAEPLTLNVGSPPFARVGVPYSHAVTVTGGIPPYQISASLPLGLSIGADGVISGTPPPNARTNHGFVSVSDSATPSRSHGASLRLRVTLEIVTTSLPDAIGGMEYRQFLIAQGGFQDLRWEVTGGSLPPDLFNFFSGQVSGTPVASCAPTTSTFDMEVTDRDTPMQTATRQGLTITVNKGPLSLPRAALRVGRVGVAYQDVIRPTLGVRPYAIAVTAGSLPSQLAINSGTGEITGTPNTSGTQTFTVQVTDDCGTTASNTFNLLIGSAPQGRNNSIATATAIGNGFYAGSVSPSGHPNTVFAPDQDYYSLTAFDASTVTIDMNGHAGEIDTVIELVDANGIRLNSCGPPAFTSECMNDDEEPGVSLDSLLQVQVPGPTTFYLRVVEWRFDGRPDLRYTFEVSGLN